MGIYDRDYYHDRQVRFVSPLGPEWRTSAVTWLIGINFAVFFLQLIVGDGLTHFLACIPRHVVDGLEVWRPLTAAFCHSTALFSHILFNMLTLFFFGGPIERLYGRTNFIAFYVTVAIAANLVHVALAYSLSTFSDLSTVYGASGCTVALVMLCVLYYPHRKVILFIFPMPLWLLGVLLVGGDLMGFFSMGGRSGTAHDVHLAGVALGVLYRFVDLRWTTLTGWLNKWRLRRRAKKAFSHVVPPSPGYPRFTEDVENRRLDRILQKISQFGRTSLSREEEKFLEDMSHRYKERQ